MEFRFTCHIRAPIAAVFAFHEDPGNLGLLMRGCAGFRLLRHGGGVRPGHETWIEQSIGVLPMVLGFRHDLYEPPYRFGERLVHGPFRAFRHVHEFLDQPEGTCVTDILDIELPIQFGGKFALRWMAASRIRALFAQRHRVYAALENEGAFGPPPAGV